MVSFLSRKIFSSQITLLAHDWKRCSPVRYLIELRVWNRKSICFFEREVIGNWEVSVVPRNGTSVWKQNSFFSQLDLFPAFNWNVPKLRKGFALAALEKTPNSKRWASEQAFPKESQLKIQLATQNTMALDDAEMLLFVQSWMLFKQLQPQSVAKTSQTKLPWAYLRILPRINRKWSGNKNFWSSILLPHSHALLRRKHNGRIKTHQVTFSACKTDCACKSLNNIHDWTKSNISASSSA